MSLEDILREARVRVQRPPSARRLLRELISRVAAGSHVPRGRGAGWPRR
jgi:hypothetical protein